MYTDCTAADLLSHESFNMKQRQQTMLSFPSPAEKSQRQTGSNNFRNKSSQILHVRDVPVLKVMIKQYAEAELSTVSVAVVASAW